VTSAEPAGESFESEARRGPDGLAAAVARVEADARAGMAPASRLLATLAGAGIGMPQDWTRALRHLVDSARLGSSWAQGQLQVLGSGEAAAPGDDRWGALAASVNIEAWTAPCDKRVLSTAPRAVAITAFLPPKIALWLIGLATGRVQPAMVYTPAGAGAVEDGSRSNSSMEFGVLNCDLVVLLTRQRIAKTINVPVGALENTQILHYAQGQRFAPHFDFLDPGLPEVAERGQRMVTVLVYLNDDFTGGETDFPRMGLRHRGAAGDALIFANLDPATGAGDRRTLHAGLPPTQGEKWLLSQWVRNRAKVASPG
jgi:prolyl 4-hydroxylase